MTETDADAIESNYTTAAVSVLLACVFSSYATLVFFGGIPLERLWYGLDKLGIATELLMVPIMLSGIGFIYWFVFSLFLINERDEHMIIALEFMYLGANMWAFFLYSSIYVSKAFKWPTILSLWTITITSITILYRIIDIGKAGEPYELIGICLGVFVVGQSIIDSVFWAINFYFN